MRNLETVQLTQQLVQIRSDKQEAELAGFIEGVVADHLPGFSTQRIQTTPDGSRPSLLIANHKYPDVILIAHGDTKGGWQKTESGKDGDGIYDPFAGEIVNGRLYGRGSGDNKIGVATGLSALNKLTGIEGQKPNVMLIVTADEEGGLTGIKTVSQYLASLRAEDQQYTPWVLSLNGSKGELGHGCRGCIEINVDIKGAGGHSAIRDDGERLPISAHKGSVLLEEDLQTALGSLPRSKLMGLTTVNLAGGTSGTLDEDGETIKTEANQVPNAFRGKFEFRPTDGILGGDFINSQTLTKLMHELVAKRGLKIARTETVLDVYAWIPDPSGLDWFEEIIKRYTGVDKVKEWSIAKHGYDEAGMAVQALNLGRKVGENRVTGAIWGMADGRFHANDEFVRIESILAQDAVVLATLQAERFNPKRYFSS